MVRKSAKNADSNESSTVSAGADVEPKVSEKSRKNGGWQEIEALRERAALKESLADVWDEDFDLDDEILAELDHKAEFFTQQDDVEEEEAFDDDDEADEFFEDDPV